MKRLLLITTLIVSGILTPVTANGVFDEQKELATARLELKGIGTARFMTIDLYRAALYLAPEQSAHQWHLEVPRQLEISYHKPIKSRHFAKATDMLLERSLSSREYRELEPKIRELLALYRDVKPGDRYTLTYLPDRGTELALNGESLGQIVGDDFSRAVFGIWLGEDSISPSLRYQLLGKKR